jgi:hypothetical protein
MEPLTAASIAPTGITPASGLDAVRPGSGDLGPKFVEILRQADGAQGDLDAAIGKAIGNPGLGGADLIALQARMYRSSLELDLASKIVEKVSSGMKQTLNTNV